MFVKTVKVKKPDTLITAMVIIVVCIIAVLVVIACRFSKKQVYEMNSETQRQEFISEMGWETSDEYDECKVITIPEEFNDVYQNYNELQKKQGFDLSDFKGKQAEVYVYKVKNYPGMEDKDGINCNLIVCDGQLIGGDVCSSELDGFMQGLKKS